jgi:hypothetical protein
MTNYRFNNEVDPETGKEKHLHEFMKDGKWTPLTGTSTVCKVIAKPLTWWASGLAVAELGWTKPADWKTCKGEAKIADEEKRLDAVAQKLKVIKEMTDADYLKLLDKAYRAHTVSLDKAADKGTDLHYQLELFVKSRMGKNDLTAFHERITPFIEWADLNVKKFIASEANCFSERLWTGGITDCIAELNDGSLAVIDFKSSKEAYKSHFIQAGGYSIQLEENGMCDATGKHCKPLPGKINQLIVVPFGSARVSPVVMRGVDEFKRAFEAAVTLYQLLENYEE